LKGSAFLLLLTTMFARRTFFSPEYLHADVS
jgi:hypothetical protein